MYPTSVDDLKPVLDLVAELGPSRQPSAGRAAPAAGKLHSLLDGWRQLGDDAGVEIHMETHRDRMTTDLFFTLHLLDRFPDLPANRRRFTLCRRARIRLAGRPVNHAMINRILDNSWGIHGRVVSREQMQV